MTHQTFPENGSEEDKSMLPSSHTDTSSAQIKPPSPRRPPLPVDNGWAWLVMLGAFINTTCLMTFVRSTALLFIEFLEVYQASATMTTLAFGLSSALFALSNILQPIVFLPRFSVRQLALAGAVTNVVTIVTIASSPSIYLTNAMYALNGFAHGFITVPQLTLVGRYFKRRLSLATSVAGLGLSIATIAGPPFTQLLLDHYGLWGAVMILGGLNLHVLPAAMLLRPTSLYHTEITSTTATSNTSNSSQDEAGKDNNDPKRTIEFDVMIVPPASDEKDTLVSKDEVNKRNSHYNNILKGTGLKTFKTESLILEKDKNKVSEWHKRLQASVGENGGKFFKSCGDLYPNSNQTQGVKLDLNEKSGGYDIPANETDSAKRLCQPHFAIDTGSSPNCEHAAGVTHQALQRDQDQSPLQRRGVEVDVETSLLDFPQDVETAQRKTTASPETVESKMAPLSCLRRLKQTKTFRVYSNPLVIVLILAAGLGGHTQAVYSYMPVMGKENGLETSQTPILLTVAGGCDLLSKVALGALADLPCVNRQLVAIICQIGVGVLLQFMHFFQGFYLMLCVQVVTGLTLGVFYILLPVITADVLGPDYIGHILSAFFLVNGSVMTLDHLIAGWVKDATGSFLGVYHYMGALFILTGVMLIAESVVKRLKGTR